MRLKLNPYYLVGFIDGEGCFSISLCKHKTLKQRKEVRLAFEIELRNDDREILERVRDTLKCGQIYKLDYERYGWRPHVKYKISKFSDIADKLIPFLKKYPLQAKKAKSFKIFVKAMELMKNREHLTVKGIQKFEKLQQRMRKIGKKNFDNR